MPDEAQSEDPEEDGGVREAVTIVNFMDPDGESIITLPVVSFPYPQEGDKVNLSEIDIDEQSIAEEDDPVEEFGVFVVKDIKRRYTKIDSNGTESMMVIANIEVEEAN